VHSDTIKILSVALTTLYLFCFIPIIIVNWKKRKKNNWCTGCTEVSLSSQITIKKKERNKYSQICLKWSTWGPKISGRLNRTENVLPTHLKWYSSSAISWNFSCSQTITFEDLYIFSFSVEQVFEVRATDELSEEWLLEKLSFFK
jgi:hypothetical protein